MRDWAKTLEAATESDIRAETTQKMEEKEEIKSFISLDHSRVYYTWNVCLCLSIC